MRQSLEELIVTQCAPTLAGLKPASLFRYQSADPRQLRAAAGRWGAELAPYGLILQILHYCPRTGACLVYLYRPDRLAGILADEASRAFLAGEGYQVGEDSRGLLRQLSRRLCLDREFPHEIGVFLGYPLEDVIGFIQNRGKNFTCSGYWKAYGDPEAARRRFDQYRRCTAAYTARFLRGATVAQLLAA